MPFRALLWTILTVALALIAVAMWLGVVERMVVQTQGVYATTGASPASEQRILVKGTLLISFVLVLLLVVIGFMAMFREWMKFSSGAWKRTRPGEKTKFV